MPNSTIDLETNTAAPIVDSSRINLEASWKRHLLPEFSKDYMIQLKSFLQNELAAKKIIYPSTQNLFAAFQHTPFEKVRVVILGQDPYHGPGQAHGLAFSVPKNIAPPPSLQNIFKELKTDIAISTPNHGNLESWADQGVLLLNSVLTVEAGSAASHQNKGWEIFTDSAIELLSEQRENLVFVLWGAYAQKKGAKINRKKHLVLESAHPSPLSAYRGFLGSNVFSKINAYLVAHAKTPIDWRLS
jgi:uracil-DNA glycosylase